MGPSYYLFLIIYLISDTNQQSFSPINNSIDNHAKQQLANNREHKYVVQHADTLLNEYYKNGIENFYRTFQKNLKYADREKFGTTILVWQVSNGKILNPFTINSLGETFDNEIAGVLGITKNHWVKKDTTVQFLLPLIFRPGEFEFYYDKFPANFLSEIIIVGYRMNIKPLTDEKLVEYLNQNVEEKNYEIALRFTDHLIERNPLNKQIRETRIFCLLKENRIEDACDDIAFLKNVLNLTSKYTCPLDH